MLLLINFGNGVIISNVLKIRTQSFVLISFLGMIGITLTATGLAFFLPLSLAVELVFLSPGLVGIILFVKSKNKLPFQTDFWFYFFLIIIIFAASFPPHLFDHFGYYVPTISFLSEVGFVKGISNLDLLLGQSSFWHIYQATFSHLSDPFLKINAYLLILFLIYIYERRQHFLLIFVPLFLIFVQQPSPDLPVVIITLIIISELLNQNKSTLIFCLSVFAFCIKPIVFWLPLFVLLNQFRQRKLNFKYIIPLAVFGILLMIKNLWLFGFPVFPVTFFDLNLPWKPSQEILTYSSQIGLMKSYDMKYSYQQIIDFNFFDKIYHWFTVGYKSVLNAGIIVSLLFIAYFSIREKSRFYTVLLFCLILKTIIILLFSAQYRFFLDVYIVALVLIIKKLSEDRAVLIALFLSVFITVNFTFPGFVQKLGLGKRMSDFRWLQLYQPQHLAQNSPIKQFKIGNLSFNASRDPVSKVHFPALSISDLKLYYYYGIFPQYFKKDLKDWIFQRKMTSQEKIQLKNIISETEKFKP